jgi:hypothetical protein
MTADIVEYPVLFWGCNGDTGHYLWSPRGKVSDLECERLNFPTRGQLDCNPMLLPHPERFGDAALTYLPAIDRTVVAWWGNRWDKRPKTNNAILIAGRANEIVCGQKFRAAFPLLAEKLPLPKIVRGNAFAEEGRTRDWFIAGLVKELQRRGYRLPDVARDYALELYRRQLAADDDDEDAVLAKDPAAIVSEDAETWYA